MEQPVLTDSISREQNLTPRETEIMKLLAKGLLDKEMADIPGISIHTVKNHLKNIYHKMNVKNRLEALIFYYNLRQVEIPD